MNLIYVDANTVSKRIDINVGGLHFITTEATLKKVPNSFFSDIMDGHIVTEIDSRGVLHIDRNGKNFELILNFLRDNDVWLPDDINELSNILIESKFYRLPKLSKALEEKISKLKCYVNSNRRKGSVIARLYENVTREDENKIQASIMFCSSGNKAIPSSRSHMILVKDSNVARSIITSTSKPVVKLTMNRYNNVFAYTSNSHDNLLRNSECLEKYALMFPETVMFIKDVSEKYENQICEWSFYYHNIKLRSLDCMAIHYSTEKRLTKVEFNDAKIHEMMLTLISVATQNLTDSEIIELSR